MEGFPVHGVGQATSAGYRLVLDRIGAKDRPVLWMSMREEPVVLINGCGSSGANANWPRVW